MKETSNFVYIATTADTKGQELEYVRRLIAALNLPTRTVDLSTRRLPFDSPADIGPEDVARHHPAGAGAVFAPVAARRSPLWRPLSNVLS